MDEPKPPRALEHIDRDLNIERSGDTSTRCWKNDCALPNHCPVCMTHHPVDSMTRFCIQTKT